MPKTAVAPLPTIHAQAARSGREHRALARPIEERLSVLETRWDTLTPELATRGNISDLRSEILKWGVGAAIALFAAFAAMFIANTARIDRLDEKIDASVAKLDAKLEQSVSRLDARMDRLDTKLDALMDELRSQRRAQQ